MTGYVWIHSEQQIVSVAEATLPFAAPAVLYGESLFETLRVRQGRFFRLNDHMVRLETSLRELGWSDDFCPDSVLKGLRALVRSFDPQVPDVRIRITVAKLDDAGRLDCLVLATPYNPPSASLYERGVSAHIATPRVAAQNTWTQRKTGQRLAYRVAKDEAVARGGWEGLLLNTDDHLADGSITNLHFILDGVVCTPSPSSGALPGIAQSVVRDISSDAGIPWQSGMYPTTALFEASEAFLTNALVGVLPLVIVDGRLIGNGAPGLLTKQLRSAYEARVDQECFSLPGDRPTI